MPLRAARMRAAGPDDYPALRALAGVWFPAETLIDPHLYRHLLSAGTIHARILERGNGPAGYYALWPLTERAYESLRRGEKRERDLVVGDIVAPEDERASVLYVSDVCAAPGRPATAMIRDLQRTIADLLLANPHITRVAAWAYSERGAKLATRLGMRPVAENPALVEIAASAARLRVQRETKVSEHKIAWEEGQAAWMEAARFFARVISADPAYISHGEIQTGLSADGKTWIPDLEARFLAEATSDQSGRSLALARDAKGAIIAAAAVSWNFENEEAPFAVLQDLAVEPSLRSRGLGAELVKFVEREARARNAAWLFLESGRENRHAHEFFERAGFQEISHVFAKRLAK